MRQFRPFSDLDLLYVIFPCEQRFLCSMAFSVYEVIRMAYPSRSWFVYFPRTTRQTSHRNGSVYSKSHAREKPLLAG